MGHGGIEMTARNAAYGIGHCQDCKAESEGYPQQAYSNLRKASRQHGAAAAAQNQPKRAKELSRKFFRHFFSPPNYPIRIKPGGGYWQVRGAARDSQTRRCPPINPFFKSFDFNWKSPIFRPISAPPDVAKLPRALTLFKSPERSFNPR